MLLELLSDFQISIPELGRIEARTQPVVLLTSNNTRELTEALKRRCLYLWLDYPSLEHELEIVKLHTPELPATRSRASSSRSSRWCASSTSRSRRRSRSRSTGRARCCCSAPTTSTPIFRETMSVIVKHRTDLDIVAERVGVQARRGPSAGAGSGRRASTRAARRAARARRRLLEFGEELRGEGVARRHRASCSTRSRRSSEVRWTEPRGLPRGARGDARQVPGGPPRLRARLRPLLLPRRRGRGASSTGSRAGRGGIDAGGDRIDLDELREQIAAGASRDGDEGAMRDLARLAIAAFGAPGRGLGRHRRRRPAHPPRARPARRAAARSAARRPARRGRCRARSSAASRR